jgi:hypothetical protein
VTGSITVDLLDLGWNIYILSAAMNDSAAAL